MLIEGQRLVAAVLLGLILVIQWVHYPSMRFYGREHFKAAHLFHTQRITHIVLPLMTLEVALVIASFVVAPTLWNSISYQAAAYCVGGIWLSTALIQVPQHRILSQLGQGPKADGYDAKVTKAVNKLVNFNWLRTALWTARLTLLYLTL